MNTTTVVKVQVGTVVRTYSANSAGLAAALAAGVQVIGLSRAVAQGRAITKAPEWNAATFWVTLDDSGLAYEIEVRASGSHRILSAAPFGEVRETYRANGYDA